MPTIVYSGGDASSGGFGGVWTVGFLLSLISDANTTVSGNATQVTYTNALTFGGTTTLVATGTFSNFDAFGDPQSGTVTGFTYTTYFAFGVPVTMTVSGISISVPTLYSWVLSNNTAALETALFGGGDSFTGTAYADHINAFGGTDTVNAGGGNDNVFGADGNDTLNGEGGNDYMNGSIGNDILNGGEGDDDLRGEDGADQLNGGLGNDMFDLCEAGDVFDGGDGVDRFFFSVNTPNYTLDLSQIGSTTGFTLPSGGVVRNMESFSLGAGVSTTLTVVGVISASNNIDLFGSNDLLIIDSSAGGGGYSIFQVASDRYNIFGSGGSLSTTGIERLVIRTAGGVDTYYGFFGVDIFDGGEGNDTLFGRDNNDVLSGGAGDDTLWGEVGFDTLNGGAGNDVLHSGGGLHGAAGSETINGDAGDDLMSASFSPENFNGGADSDTVSYAMSGAITLDLQTPSLSTGDAVGDTFVSLEMIVGSDQDDALRGDGGSNGFNGGLGNDTIEGRDGADLLIGDYGDDTINGDSGADDMRGGYGNDTYYVDDSGDLITEVSTLGQTDHVLAAVSYTLAAEIENLTLVGLAGINGTGNDLDNVLTGNGADNLLAGLDGADSLLGGDGADTLTGGSGADSISGGAGDDVIHYNFGDGIDASIDGGTGADRIVTQGNSGGETLDVRWNGTSFTAFKGSTVVSVEEAIVDMGGGVDWLRQHNSALAISINLGAGTATGFISIANIENAWGSAFADTLTGSSVANTIRGAAGDDVIDGGGDNDTLIGDDGVDTISGSDGNDAIYGLSGADAINAGDGDDTIYYSFGEGVDAIDGGAGTDTIICQGNSGAETLEVAWNGTSFTFFKGGAVASIEQAIADMGVGGDWLRYTGSTVGVTINLTTNTASGFVSIANVENAAGGSGNDTITGSSVANNLIGNDGADVLDGGGGNDTLNGGAGADTLTGGAGSDSLTGGADSDAFVFATGSAGDTVNDFDANATGGQDFLDLAGYGVTSADFAARVVITDQGVNTLVTIDGAATIVLLGVTGDGNNLITQADFILGS
ncbi:MAG: beta strand repeat-containing protein [Caulobacteraceae bacterium]